MWRPCRSNLLYGIIAEFCTETACPVMCAGPKYEYMWADGQTIKKPISCSAPRYVDYLLTWVPATPPTAALHPHTPLPAPLPAPRRAAQVQNLLDDERIFPTEIGRPFPSDFMEHIRNIFKARPPPSLALPLALTLPLTLTVPLTLTPTPRPHPYP